jgi:hypothetical protein
MKSVPNLIFYPYKVFWNFSQFLAICFELFSFGVIFNSEIADEWDTPVRRRVPRRARVQRDSASRVPTAPPRQRQPPRARRLVDRAVAPTASPTTPLPRPPR